jgi:phosphate transport system permease protein
MESKQYFSSGEEAIKKVKERKTRGLIFQIFFIFATILSVLFLIILLVSIIDQVFGYAALVDERPLSSFSLQVDSLNELSRDQLITLANENISSGILRKVEYDEPLRQRSDKEIISLVEQYVIKPQVLRTWGLWDSLTQKEEIESFVLSQENGYLSFRSWVTPSFLQGSQSANPLVAGIRTAFLGSMWILLVTFIFAFPFGIGAAIYLQEYAPKNRLTNIMQLNIFNLSAVPSIIYGLLGLAFFVRVMEPVTSGAIFSQLSTTVANGRTILSGGLTLGLLVLPIIIINTQEAIKAVPDTLRMSSYGLGATKWQTIWHHVLPASFSRILTGTILALSRALGETAPLVVIGASTFISVDPTGIFSKFTTLPIQIYQWSARPQGAYRSIAAGAIITLLVLLLVINSSAIIMRERISRKKRLEA